LDDFKPWENNIRMKFKIVENDINTFLDMIKRECKPFLNQAGSDKFSMYQGVNMKDNFDEIPFGDFKIYKKRVRGNRKPSDTDVKLSNIIDEYLNKRYNLGGWKPRTQSKFFTGSAIATQEYGLTYIGFPIGDFKYLWSPEIKDLWRITYKIMWGDESLNYLKDILDGKPSKNIYEIDQFAELLNTYKFTDLDEGINSGNEIMIGPANLEYYLIWENDFNYWMKDEI